MAVRFIPVDRHTPHLFPPSIQDYLPEDHLARFVVDIVEQLDLSALTSSYSGRGSQPYHPALMVALLFYGYATGTFSGRQLESGHPRYRKSASAEVFTWRTLRQNIATRIELRSGIFRDIPVYSGLRSRFS